MPGLAFQVFTAVFSVYSVCCDGGGEGEGLVTRHGPLDGGGVQPDEV